MAMFGYAIKEADGDYFSSKSLLLIIRKSIESLEVALSVP